jgi:hypothetical protein
VAKYRGSVLSTNIVGIVVTDMVQFEIKATVAALLTRAPGSGPDGGVARLLVSAFCWLSFGPQPSNPGPAWALRALSAALFTPVSFPVASSIKF